MKGFSQNRRLLFPVKKTFVMCEITDFKACGKVAEDSGLIKCGVKSSTPLNRITKLPWNCPINPMHQIFLGTSKVLSKLMISLAKGPIMQRVETLLSREKVPFEIQHRTKSLSDLQFWKAFDFKLFFFHVAPLVFADMPLNKAYFQSFVLLCSAIRLLSQIEVSQEKILEAEKLVKYFFEDFTILFGSDSQSFNFHNMRHISE